MVRKLAITQTISDLKTLLKHLKSSKTSIGLGIGGALKAICYVLEQLSIQVLKVSRNEAKDKKTYAQLTKKDYIDHTLIINCTP